MDFAGVIEEVAAFLATAKQPYAVAGGVALAAYGHPRLTLDLDLVVHADVQDALIGFMESLDYATLHRSTGFSNHRHSDPARGRVDFIYVRNQTADRVFAGLRSLAGPAGTLVPVPRPEHLIAMKVQAIKNEPERTWQDMVDIGYLLGLPGTDHDEVRGYFERAGLQERWRELEQRL